MLGRTMPTDDHVTFQSQRVTERRLADRAGESRCADLGMVRNVGIVLGSGRELLPAHTAMIGRLSPWTRHSGRELGRGEGGVFG